MATASATSLATSESIKAYADSVGGGIANVVEDTTPQLGGALDANGKDIKFDNNTGIKDSNNNEQIRFIQTTSAVNHLDITNSATGNAVGLDTAGGDTNIDLDLGFSGSGGLKINSSAAKIDTILDDDTMAADDATALCTQQSIKAYVDGPRVISATSISFDAGTNVLDEYEEGTFTPTFTFATPGDLSVVYGVQTGAYVRVGNVVHIVITLQATPTFTTASGQVRMGGLPFTSGAYNHALTLSNKTVLTFNGSDTFGSGYTSGSTYCRLRSMSSAGSATDLTPANFTSTSSHIVAFSGSYLI
jgi:hypothetical protein